MPRLIETLRSRSTVSGFAIFAGLVFATAQTLVAQVPSSRVIVAPKMIPAMRIVPQDGLPAEAMMQAAMVPGAAAAPNAEGTASAEPPPNQRLEMLLQLTFDRRVAGYLEAWAQENIPDDDSQPDSDNEDVASDSSPSAGSADDSKDELLPPQPPSAAERSTARRKRIEKEVKRFQADVILGRWQAVRDYLENLPDEDAKQVYGHVLNGLMAVSMDPPQTADPEAMQLFQMQQQALSMGIEQVHLLSPEDILGLADAAPEAMDDDQLKQLSQMVMKSQQNGFALNGLEEMLKQGTRYLGGSDADNRLRAGKLLVHANQAEIASAFLPDRGKALSEQDTDQLLLVVDYLEQTYQRDKKAEQLEENWHLVQAMLEFDDLKVKQRQTLLEKAVGLSTRVRDELGLAWLRESFTSQPERGLQILSNMGVNAAQSLLVDFHQPAKRLAALKLQNSAVESLLEHAPELATEWQATLDMLLQNWMNEVDIALKHYFSNSSRPRMQVDMYGNFFWADQNMMNQQYMNQPNQIRPVNVFELIKLRPSNQWQQRISDNLKTEFSARMASLHLKNEEAEESFPFVETVCQRDPKRGRRLVNEFLQAWIKAHDPNTANRNRNPYIYMYGYDMKAEGIPLTRSKQERNLSELKAWISRIRELPIEPVDDKILARAFTTCHSQAEVFRLESFENVFGSIESLEPETVAGIVHTMRENLAGKWRSVRLQEEAKTNRKQPEIQKDVITGYEAALTLVEQSLAKSPESWELMTAKACVFFDQNAYQNSIQKSSQFSHRRDDAFDFFEKATELYRSTATGLEQNELSIDPYQRWFYASLGACDVGQITHETVPDVRQHARIREALERLPGELAEIHMGKFANDLFTRMSPLKPQVKFRYLDGGFTIVGDHDRAEEARKVYEYYRDLVTEIKLDIQIDGSDCVGHEQPFGLFVNLVHTPEIERESGGFAKYVQNQNQMPFAYNYGRPTEDYRDKFREATAAALSEHFEVQSIIFEDPKSLKSREFSPGWRITPYAYVLLKARGPEVDQVPPLKIDFDFLDTSGYAVLPIKSQMLPLDRSNPAGEPRPVKDLEIVQTLDERRAEEGKLILEVKAEATGLVPELDALLDLDIEGFSVVNVDDQTVVPTQFDDSSNDIQIKSDRSWTVEMEADGEERPEAFHFCQAIVTDAENRFQRYEDADLVEVDSTVSLEEVYAESQNFAWLLLPIALGGMMLVLLAVAILLLFNSNPKAEARFAMPGEVNPFTVIGLLKDIDANGRLKDSDRNQIQQSINRVEHYYFDQRNGDSEPDLKKIASQWLRKV